MQKLKNLCLILCFISSATMACQPLDPKFRDDSTSRVKSNFDEAQFVVTANVIKIQKILVQVSHESHFQTEVERASFRLTHAFKGRLKPGDKFDVDSGVTFCALGVLHDDWIPLIPGRKQPDKSAYPKRWLIYYTPPPVMKGPGPKFPAFEITSSPRSRPANFAAYDINVLTQFSGKWKGEIGR